MRGLILAWLVAEGIICYRSVTADHRPPMPGALLGSSALFVILALVGEVNPALATTFAVGVDAAAFLALPGFGQPATPVTPKPGQHGAGLAPGGHI